MCGATRHVRFIPNSDRESGLPHTVMSALPPKTDTWSARAMSAKGQERTILVKFDLLKHIGTYGKTTR